MLRKLTFISKNFKVACLSFVSSEIFFNQTFGKIKCLQSQYYEISRYLFDLKIRISQVSEFLKQLKIGSNIDRKKTGS